MFIELILAGFFLCFWGWRQKTRNDGAVIVTGTVVSMRRTVEYLDENENKESGLLTRYLTPYPGTRYGRLRVEVYRPIVRFTYLGDVREAVVDERCFIKPTLNVSMEIAFFPEDLAHAWRPAKKAVFGDVLIFAGVICIVLGVLLFLGVPLPFGFSRGRLETF